MRLAVLSLHSSPLAQPGVGDSGGMNVYVRELVGAAAQAGLDCTVYVRRDRLDLPDEVHVEPGFRVVHIDAGPVDLPKEALPAVVDEFADGVRARLTTDRPADVIHAHYWLSAQAGHRLKHELDLPLVTTFHTLGSVKTLTGDPEPVDRMAAEAAIIACSDVIMANSAAERHQLVDLCGAPADRVEVVAPGVLHAFFSPGDQGGARAALGLPRHGPVLLFVGRIQPLKGLDVAVEALAHLDRPDATLVVVGGPSGQDGGAELTRVKGLVQARGLDQQVRFVDPQPHHTLSTYYRAASVCLVPSRSESFGLVALEAASCGIPVVASAVGGLLTLVDHGRTGLLVPDRDPRSFASAVHHLLEHPIEAAEMGMAAAETARGYTWALTAARLRRIAADLATRAPVDCAA